VHALEAVKVEGRERSYPQWTPENPAALVGEPLTFEISTTFDFASAEYAQLFERSAATAFQHPIWLDRMFEHLAGARGRSVSVLTGRTKIDGRLVFALPMIKRRLGVFGVFDAADFDVGDYNALVIDQGDASSPAVLQQILSALTRLQLMRVRRVHDGEIGFPSGGHALRTSTMDFNAHEVELKAPAEGWQARILKADFVRFLAKKRKRLGAKGKIAFELVSEPDRIRAAFESMRRFRQGRWAKDLLSDHRFFEFYVDIAISGQAADFSRTYTLSVNGAIVAVLFGICHRGRFCFLLLGFDMENFRNFSTGLLALEDAISDCMRRGDEIFDLTIGDEEYKQNFATRSVPMSVHWFGKMPWTSLAPLALTAAIRARALIRKLRKPAVKVAAG
jgi:CelD/BcsL family acetyltransferase involved in cellulose biosynthesis